MLIFTFCHLPPYPNAEDKSISSINIKRKERREEWGREEGREEGEKRARKGNKEGGKEGRKPNVEMWILHKRYMCYHYLAIRRVTILHTYKKEFFPLVFVHIYKYVHI
jgi:hypothetical protein